MADADICGPLGMGVDKRSIVRLEIPKALTFGYLEPGGQGAACNSVGLGPG